MKTQSNTNDFCSQMELRTTITPGDIGAVIRLHGILYLYGTEEPTRQKRFLRVMKMRGTDACFSFSISLVRMS